MAPHLRLPLADRYLPSLDVIERAPHLPHVLAGVPANEQGSKGVAYSGHDDSVWATCCSTGSHLDLGLE